MDIRKRKIRRRFLRRSACRKVGVTCDQKNASCLAEAPTYVLDISEGGTRLLMRVILQLNQPVEVRFHGSAIRQPLTRQGRVVWCFRVTEHDHAVGIQFEELLTLTDVRQVTVPPGCIAS